MTAASHLGNRKQPTAKAPPERAKGQAVARGARVVALYELETMAEGNGALGEVVVSGDIESRTPIGADLFSEASSDFRFTAAVALLALEQRGTHAEESAAELAIAAASGKAERLAFAEHNKGLH